MPTASSADAAASCSASYRTARRRAGLAIWPRAGHGQRGELRQAYREGQEDQLGALGLVLNAVVLWNTRYTDAALTRLRAQGDVGSADAARLSPLVDQHVNMLGRYAFTQPPGAGLRPLRDPAASAEDA